MWTLAPWEIHHGKHHAAYVNNLNAALQGTEHENKDLEELLAAISKLPPAVHNNGGGHWTASMFWEIMAPNAGGEPTGDVASKIDKNFGSFEEMKKQFAQAAATRFGSGWAWLCVDADDNLFITSTPNQDNPLMDVADKKGDPSSASTCGNTPPTSTTKTAAPTMWLLGGNVVNWDEVNRRYRSAVRSN